MTRLFSFFLFFFVGLFFFFEEDPEKKKFIDPGFNRAEFLAAGRACKAQLWSAPG